ncbi:MAG: iron ABC transporter permease [Bradyrhizobiaceae bacterium]|nr:iron ABC transporter permease [Bradyrhizobiaceae bacterium]
MSATITIAAMQPLPVRRGGLVIAAAAVFLVAALLASLAIGPVYIAPGRVVGTLIDALAGARPSEGTGMRDAVVVLDIRLPRTVLAMLVGGGLAVAGAVLQGVFRNPLADPGLVGVSPGAALAAVLWIIFGSAAAGYLPGSVAAFGLPLAAFAGGLVTTVLLYRIATREGRTSVAMLLFAGIALGAMAAAGTGLAVFVASDQQLREFTFWTLGSLGGASWQKIAAAAPFILLLIVGSRWLARGLDALALGEAEAFHVGVNTELLKRVAIVLVAAGVGASVAVSGVIGFIGLVVPHLLRLSAGPSHARLLVGCALLGGALLIASDIVARTIVSPAELPLGVVTAILGTPYFLYLVQRNRAVLGG